MAQRHYPHEAEDGRRRAEEEQQSAQSSGKRRRAPGICTLSQYEQAIVGVEPSHKRRSIPISGYSQPHDEGSGLVVPLDMPALTHSLPRGKGRDLLIILTLYSLFRCCCFLSCIGVFLTSMAGGGV